MLKFSCPYCRKLLSAPPEKARTAVRCPKCKNSLKIPSPAAYRPTPKTKPAAKSSNANHSRSRWYLALPIGFVLVGALAIGLVYANDRFGLTGGKLKDVLAEIVDNSGSPKNDEVSPQSSKGNEPNGPTSEKEDSHSDIEPVKLPEVEEKDTVQSGKDSSTKTPNKKLDEPKQDTTPPIKKTSPPPKPKAPTDKTEPPKTKVEPPKNPVTPPKNEPKTPPKKVEPPVKPPPPPKEQTNPPKKTGAPTKNAGFPIGSRTKADIRAALLEIEKAPIGIKDAVKRERIAALNRLKAYRYLVGLPYKHLSLDDEMNKYTLAAADICKRLKTLTHNPKNPGLPEAQYQIALKGCKSSNLFGGFQGTMPKSVDFYMFDSDQFNIARLGHRRWCLNPYMGKTGFGRAGSFSAMWTFDRSYNKPMKLDAIRFPPEGIMPMDYFSANHAWSVTLNPMKFRMPPKSVEIKMFVFDKAGNKGNAVKINYKNVDGLPFGIIRNCIVFRPAKSAVAPGRRLQVEIEGLTITTGQAYTMRYQVEFVRLQ